MLKKKENLEMKREENWNHLNVKRSLRAYDTQMARINKNLSSELTGAQHTALMVLAQYRHRLHSARANKGLAVASSREDISNFFLNQLDVLIRSTKLPSLDLRYFPVDIIEDEAVRARYIDDVNEKIEDYLDDIDKKYGTMYCPTGARRMRRTALAVAV